MRHRKKIILFFGVILPLLTGILLFPLQQGAMIPNEDGSNYYETDSGDLIEIGSDETVYEYRLSDVPTQMTGTSDSLSASEYGNRTDSFSNVQLYYDSGTQTTSGASLQVPLGTGWEGYKVFTNVTSITENRTWVANSGFDADTDWNWYTHDEPSIYNISNPPFTSQWISTGGNPGGAAQFQLDGYYYDAGGGLYGYWYDIGDKAYAVQNLTIDRGDVTQIGISLDYWADITWSSLTGFCEIFVSVGDPDNGGTYLWSMEFDSMAASATWFSSGYVTVDVSTLTLPNISLWVGLRTTAFEWWRPDTEPQARVDNLVVYITAKATPSNINLQMNGVSVNDVFSGSTPIFGLGTATDTSNIFTGGAAFANFTWTPIPNPPDPNLDINIALDVSVTVWARRYNVLTINNTELFTLGDNYVVQNGTDVRWETNHYAAVPGGYSSKYYFNVSLPSNRDIDFVAQPYARTVNLTSGWSYGNPGDGLVNISVFQITQTNQNGFWLLKGSSPNMITNVEVWDSTLAQWTRTHTFRANEDTRFRATLSPTYTNDVVTFTVYSPNTSVWVTLQGTVDGSGYAITPFVNLDAANASVGLWEVQAFSTDAISQAEVHNVGFFTRTFDIEHSTSMNVKYPVDAVVSWTTNVTYGDLVLLQVRVNDSDNGDLLSGGTLNYNWAGGSGTMSDLGTGEYSVTLDTTTLPSNGQYDVSLSWSKSYYDPIVATFTINAIYTTDLFSAEAPGVDVPQGYDAELTVEFKDQTLTGIDLATISINWTLDTYTVTPDGVTPGKYLISLQTNTVPLGTYVVAITAEKDFFESRTILLSVQVRELFTSAIPSTSVLSLPVGYTTSFTITYTDTDHNTPITGAESAISSNWSAIHKSGDMNYTVTESATPGVYTVDIYSSDLDTLGVYTVVFNVEQYGVQNHTFTVTVELRTHLTSFYLVNPVDPTPYTGDISISVRYFDTDADTGIENGSIVGYNVRIDVVSDTLPGLVFTVQNGTEAGEYIIYIDASQWGSIGSQVLHIYANWTGPTVKYTNETLDVTARIIEAPTDIFIGESPVMTPYGENVTFTIIYYDLGNDTGIVNGTGAYLGNVRIYVEVLTAGQALTQQNMVITEVDYINSPGEYRIEFNTSYLSGLIGCDLRVWMNWTKGVLPYYANQSLQLTVYSTYRLTTVEWNPLPLTPYDELVNLSLTYKDVLTGNVILNAPNLTITVPGYGFTIYYDGDLTGIFFIEVDTSVWVPGENSFTVSIEWSGVPYYQNRTGISISITTRYRYTELTHGAYAPVQYGNNVTILFSYRDLDDYTTTGMNGGTLTLDASLSGFYWVTDNGDGTYSLELSTFAFAVLGYYHINVSIAYGGIRYCNDATDSFYLSVVQRRTQLTSELPDLAPYLTLANISVNYIDDSNGTGIVSANVFAECSNASTPLELNTNYWVDDLGTGEYVIRISTQALGTFGSYLVTITVNWTGAPYYVERVRDIAIEVSRREARLVVTKSPLNTPFLENVTFEFTATDGLSGSSIALTKSHLTVSYGSGTTLPDTSYSLSYDGTTYSISIDSQLITSVLVDSLLIQLDFIWGDVSPYYANATTSTQASITSRLTQSGILSTPPASYGYNMTAIITYSDYLSGSDIVGASITVECLNETSIQFWWFDNNDGTYTIRVNSSGFVKMGRYFFRANITWFGSPYYQNKTAISYSVILTPVATVLTLQTSGGSTNYLGEIVEVNVTFTEADTGIGIDGANVTSDWNTTYSTIMTITPLGNGIYQLLINTSGLDAQKYPFMINASKFIHVNKSIDVEILLAAIPVNIEVSIVPETPLWGDLITIQLNITNALNGNPIAGGVTNVTILSDTYVFTYVANGIYQTTFNSKIYDAGDYSLTIQFEKVNHEVRQFDSQLRIEKIASKIAADLTPFSTVNGDTVAVYVDYEIQSNGTDIPNGVVTFSWIGGSGSLIWSSTENRYVGQFTINDVIVGSHKILIQASSTNYRDINTQVTLEVNVIETEMVAANVVTYIEVVANNNFTVTVYLNNTDLSQPITGATLTYSLGDIIGNLTEIGNGYYSANISTLGLEIKTWILTITSSREGYAPSSIQFTIEIDDAPTEIIILTDTQIDVYYGQNATFRFNFWDVGFDEGVPGADATFLFSAFGGNLTDYDNGTYSMTIDTSLLVSSSVPYQITVSFEKDGYKFSNVIVRLLVNPIPTEIIGNEHPVIPWGDDYSQSFSYYDSLNDQWVTDAINTVFWEFGTIALSDAGNGTYFFGPDITGETTLPIGNYSLRIVLSKENYERRVMEVTLTIRPIRTTVFFESPSPSAFAGGLVILNLTYWDLDHNIPIYDATNSTEGTNAERLVDEEHQGTNGTYFFYFRLNDIGRYEIVVTLSSSNHEDSVAKVIIHAVATEEQIAAQNAFRWGSIGILALFAFAALWFRVLSIPKMLRWIRSMISTLSKGRIPSPKPVRSRRKMMLEWINEELEPIGIVKPPEDISEYSVEVETLDTERLLEELATLVGLTEADTAVLRRDLDKMKPSERGGFLNEVIRQERARRAKEIADAAEAPARAAEEAEARLSEEELADLKAQLLKMGIEESEAELMMEQARHLSKAEIQALLDQLGGMKE